MAEAPHIAGKRSGLSFDDVHGQPHSPGPAQTSLGQSPSFARYDGKLNVHCRQLRDAKALEAKSPQPMEPKILATRAGKAE